MKEDSKIYQNARDLEKFFDQQLKKWLPKFARKISTDQIISLTDLIDDDVVDDVNDADYVPSGGRKRMRSSSSL